MVSSIPSGRKRLIEIGSGGKPGSATIANWPVLPWAKAGSVPVSVSVVVSAVSWRVATTRAVTKSFGVAATGSTIGVSGTSGTAGAIALSSSRTSMPTGHQVMQRPQPTQPELPNWSHQVANLWVSHCR